jgi:hypothetical protein
MDLYDFMNHADMGGPEGQGSSSWGWTAKNGREFGIVGQFTGAAFVEVLKNGKLQYLGRLPAQSVGSRWREIRVLNDYVIIVSYCYTTCLYETLLTWYLHHYRVAKLLATTFRVSQQTMILKYAVLTRSSL